MRGQHRPRPPSAQRLTLFRQLAALATSRRVKSPRSSPWTAIRTIFGSVVRFLRASLTPPLGPRRAGLTFAAPLRACIRLRGSRSRCSRAELRFPGNHISDEGVTALAWALERNTSLKKLGLSGSYPAQPPTHPAHVLCFFSFRESIWRRGRVRPCRCPSQELLAREALASLYDSASVPTSRIPHPQHRQSQDYRRRRSRSPRRPPRESRARSVRR